MSVSVRIEGLDELMRRLRADQLVVPSLKRAFDKVGLLIQTEARKRAPVDRGTLRASIKYQTGADKSGPYVDVIATEKYAPYMEYGTGTAHDHPNWPRKRHMVPAGVLDKWASRKGLEAGAVMVAINKRGGLKPRRFLRGAIEDNSEKVTRIVAGELKKMADAGL